MKTKRQAQREARQMYQLCVVNGSLDDRRVRQVVQRLVDSGRPGALAILTPLQRLLRLDRQKRSAAVESAAPLTAQARATMEAGLLGRFGQGIVVSFKDNPALIGGVRIKVGSNVYDGSVQGRLAALASRF
jgi:F-type H+-transporting ATPase subunit delta